MARLQSLSLASKFDIFTRFSKSGVKNILCPLAVIQRVLKKSRLRLYLPLIITIFFLVSLTGCGYFEGNSVQNYLQNVARIQYESDTSLQDLDKDIADLGRDDLKTVGQAIDRLKNKQGVAETTRDSLEEMNAPESASSLKSHLLDLYGQGAENIGALAASGDYRIVFEPLFSEYETSSKDFSEKVKNSDDPNSLLTNLKSYKNAVASISDRARKIEPPMLYLRSHQRFIENLATLEMGLNETIAGIENGDSARIEEASAKMAQVDGEKMRETFNAQRANDIKEYNSKIQRMNELAQLVIQDQAELHQKFDKQ